MKTGDRPERHPLCTCPELTWDAATGRAPAPDLEACRSRALVDPHPVLTAEDLAELRAEGGPVVRMAIETRPQDWAEPARRIPRARGAWRGRT